MLCPEGIPHRPGDDECSLQFWMNRHHRGLAPLPLSYPQRRRIGVHMEAADLQDENFRDPKAGLPLFQHEEPSLGIGSCVDEGVDFGCFQPIRNAATFLSG